MHNFQSQNLTVNYITFNFRNGKIRIQEITKIFNSFYSFDCYLVDNKQSNDMIWVEDRQ